MLIGKNEIGFKVGLEIVCKRNELGVFVSRGGLLKKHFLADISDACIVVESSYEKLTPGNKTEIGGKLGWALGPIGVGIGAAIGGMLDEKDKKSGAAIRLTYEDGKELDLLCTSKELAKLNDIVLAPMGISLVDQGRASSEPNAEEYVVGEFDVEAQPKPDPEKAHISAGQIDLQSELTKLDDLRKSGLIDDQEFAELKRKLLDSYAS